MSENVMLRAVNEILPIFTRNRTWRALAMADIRSKYRRTVLGPWWITVSNGIFALIIGTVSGRFLGSDMSSYLPFFIIGLTIWNFMAASITEGCTTLIQSSGLIKATNLPLSLYVMRMVQRNFIIFLHNSVIIPIIWLVYPWSVGAGALLSVVGFFAIYVCAVCWSLSISIICTRYRDIPPAITALVQLLFFVSPIIWQPEQLRGGHEVLKYNPIAHLLAVARDPLLGKTIPLESWLAVALTVIVSIVIAAAIYLRYRRRVVFWV